MKTLVVFFLLAIAVASAQRLRVRIPIFPPVFPQFPGRGSPFANDEYAASLSGAPVGEYHKINNFGGNRGSYYSGSEVHGISLGNAKVGLYGNDRENNRNNFPLYG